MTRKSKISEEVIDDVESCFTSDGKNIDKCVDKRLEEHGLSQDDKARVLMKVTKRAIE